MPGRNDHLQNRDAWKTGEHDRPPNFEYLFISPAGRILARSDFTGHKFCQILTGWLVFLAYAAILWSTAAVAAPADPVKREILALYDGREEARPDQTRVHRFAEMPLNHLGFVVTYWDVSTGLPAPERTANIHGLLAWFRRPQTNDFYVWARDEVQHGIRMVVLGDSGLVSGNETLEEANGLFAEIGFHTSGAFVDLTYETRVLHRDALIGFEREPDRVLPGFPVIETIGGDVVSHLTLAYPDTGSTLSSSVVLTSSRGGFAATGYTIYEEPNTARTKWLVDPFAFFRQAYGVKVAPIPDVTTLSGRRIYFSHIDGDGWNNVTRIESYRDKPTIAAEVVERELIKPYPDLPVSIGVIGADVDDRYGQVGAARRVARQLYALPQVEVATHSYTHPYQWSFFESYDRQAEEHILGGGDSEWMNALSERVGWVVKHLFPRVAQKPHTESGAEAGADDKDPPRAYAEFPFDPEQEFDGAIRASEELAPKGKRTALYLWSGGAEPYAAAIAETRKLGVRNMNGGDSRFDSDYPSISYLAPVARPVGAERQIYAGNANDYLYVYADGRNHGFLNLQSTLAATEEPRRLKPINVYYHMFAGEYPAQLAGVRHHLDAARQAPLTPISASHYAAIADGFFSTEIIALDESSWLIRNRGALETMRFDDAAALSVDFARSVGVVGQRRKGTSLYVALDEAQEDVLLVLAPAATPRATPTVPYLVDGRWTFRDLERHDCGFKVMAKGYGPGQMTWGGLAPGIYHVVVRPAAEASQWEGSAEVDDGGRLALTADVDALAQVAIDVTCAEPDGP